MGKIANGKRYETTRLISGTRYTDPNDFKHWLNTIVPGRWTDWQAFPPDKKGGWTNKQIFPSGRPQRRIWRRKHERPKCVFCPTSAKETRAQETAWGRVRRGRS